MVCPMVSPLAQVYQRARIASIPPRYAPNRVESSFTSPVMGTRTWAIESRSRMVTLRRCNPARKPVEWRRVLGLVLNQVFDILHG